MLTVVQVDSVMQVVSVVEDFLSKLTSRIR